MSKTMESKHTPEQRAEAYGLNRVPANEEDGGYVGPEQMREILREAFKAGWKDRDEQFNEMKALLERLVNAEDALQMFGCRQDAITLLNQLNYGR